MRVKVIKPVTEIKYVKVTKTRWQEIRARGASIEEHKLAFHCAMIVASTVLTILGTSAMFALWHIGMVIPTFPALLQEIWDWMFKQ